MTGFSWPFCTQPSPLLMACRRHKLESYLLVESQPPLLFPRNPHRTPGQRGTGRLLDPAPPPSSPPSPVQPFKQELVVVSPMVPAPSAAFPCAVALPDRDPAVGGCSWGLLNLIHRGSCSSQPSLSPTPHLIQMPRVKSSRKRGSRVTWKQDRGAKRNLRCQQAGAEGKVLTRA